MLKQIGVDDVELGMFIHKLEGSWFKHPFWKSRFVLDDAGTLQTLKASQISHVVIDTSKGRDLASPATEPRVQAAPAPRLPHVRTALPRPREQAAPSAAGAPPRSTMPQSTAREFGNAKLVAAQSRKVISKVFLEARLGKGLDTSAVAPVIEDIYASVQRNPYAFSGLMRCKATNEFVYRHALSVSALMISLAKQMRLAPGETREAGLAGLLLDIGVSNLPLDGASTDGDYRNLDPGVWNKHIDLGRLMLSEAGLPEAVLNACERHHEHLDGTGFPRGLKDAEIDQLSRMAAVCDHFDNAVASGSASNGIDPSTAIAQLSAEPARFDEEIVRHFIQACGVYPIGSFVQLRSDRLAMVIDVDPHDSSRPVVRTFYSLARGERLRGENIELATCYGEDAIVGIGSIDGLELPEPSQLRDLLFIAGCKSRR